MLIVNFQKIKEIKRIDKIKLIDNSIKQSQKNLIIKRLMRDQLQMILKNLSLISIIIKTNYFHQNIKLKTNLITLRYLIQDKIQRIFS